MLAKTLGSKFSSYPCFAQPKLNGVRCLYQHGTDGGVVFQSRDEKLIHIPKIKQIVDELASLGSLIGHSILDGELYVHGWRLQRINGAVSVNSKQVTDDSLHLEYHVFDVVDPKLKFSDRYLEFFNSCPKDLSFVKPVSTVLLADKNDMNLHFNHWVGQGYEGIMLRPDGPYELSGSTGRRSQYLWKYKSWQDGEFMCVGITPGEGKAGIGIGALILQGPPNPRDYRLPNSTFKVGTGFDDNDRSIFYLNPPIRKMIKIRYLELTADGIPFNPSFLCVV